MNAKQINDTSLMVTRWLFFVLPITVFVDLSHFFLRGNFKALGRFTEPTSWVSGAFGFGIMLVLPTIFVALSNALKLSRNILIPSLASGILFSYYLVYIEFNHTWIDIFLTVFMPLSVLVAFFSIYSLARNGDSSQEGWARLFWRVFWLCAFLATGVASFLEVTPVIFPATYDYQMHHIDAAFNYPAVKLTSWIAAWPEPARQFLQMVYDFIGWIYIPVIALVLREGKGETLNIWRTYIYALGMAMLCYAFIPVSGPLYAFGPALFPSNMPDLAMIPKVTTVIQPAFRNGMPSMHFTSAVTLVFICAALKNKWIFYSSIVFMLATMLSTTSFGEHYIIDLIVAATYSVTLSVLLIGRRRYLAQNLFAKISLYFAGVTFVFWMFTFKFASQWLIANQGVILGLSAWSIFLFCSVTYFHIKSVWNMDSCVETTLVKNKEFSLLSSDLKGNFWIVGAFFFSGVAGLIYEVVFAKALAVTFGASSLAINTVLATYMGGMAIGAWLGSKIAQRKSNLLKLYAITEASIGLYALLTPLLFGLIQNIYIGLATDRSSDSAELTLLRLGLGALVLGPATILMGATFPIMFARLRQIGVISERAIAPLYAANVLGAAFGALFAGYMLIPAVGKNSATYIAALLSLLVALYTLEKEKTASTNINDMLATVLERSNVGVIRRVGVVAVLILLVGGAVTMGLEVLYMHMLAVIAGNSVYAFGLMLSTFLLGLGIGSAIGERLIRFFSRETVIVLAQSGLAASIITSSLMWDSLADYFTYFGGYEAMGIHIPFGGREYIRALVCAVAMLPSALFVGMNYPACMGIATDWFGQRGGEVSGLGKASGINTFGNISGVLLVGFWLLPTLGSRNSLFVLTAISIAAAIMMKFLNPASNTCVKQNRYTLASVVMASGLLICFPSDWNFDKLSKGANVYFYPQEWGRVIEHSESVEGGLTTVTTSPDGLLTLLTNGKFQGNNAEHGEMVAQKSFALIPLLHTSKRSSALVIGYGTGMTPRVVVENGFSDLDVAELSKDMVNMADRHFENINHAVTSKSGVSIYFTDGRNFLLTQSKKYDLISIEISSIWFAGAANLYNKEFYDLVSRRLNGDGVMQQWVQLHHMQPLDFLYVIGSLRSSFKYVWFYISGGQGIVVASNSLAAVPTQAYKETLLTTMRSSDLTIDDLGRRLVADPGQIDAMLSAFDPTMSSLVSTDNNLYLEYATPKGNALHFDTVPMIIRLLTNSYVAK